MASSEQIRAARGLLALSQQELADRAKVARRTILRLENEEVPTQPWVLAKIVETLEGEGVRFLKLEDGSTGAVLLPAARAAVMERLPTKVRNPGEPSSKPE